MIRYAVCAALMAAACSQPLPEDLQCTGLPVAEMVPQVSQGIVMTPEEAQIFGMGAMFQERADAVPAPARPAARAAPLPRVDVALISAGGQWGAFTAGFMTGWSENRVDPRPAAFDVVTGVSTGAILAPLVFAGPEFDAALAEAYDGIRERDVLRRRPTLELVGAPSLWDPTPLEGLIDRQLTPQL
ncbi:MAG: patatin-like phospholipase family protein, partial [Pseudomonadota bacterium]